MKKKNKNKARKSITAVGAVVAAGLTPGIVNATPGIVTGPQAPQAPATDIELTAADVVSINGEVFDFDDLFAMHQVNRGQRDKPKLVYGPPQPKVYGPVPPQKDKDKKKKKDKNQQIREQEIADSLLLEDLKRAAEAEARARAIEQARKDSIQRAIIENQKVVYGPPPPSQIIDSESIREIAANDKLEATRIIRNELVDFVRQTRDSENFSPHSNIISDLEFNSQQQEALSQIVEDRFGVLLTNDMMKRLGTVERIVNFIVEVITPIKKED